MNRNSPQAGTSSRMKPAFRLLLAATLASGLAMAGPSPAFAKDKPEAPAQGNSKAFIQAYAPLQAIVNSPSGDFAAAKAMIPTVQAAVQNNADKQTFGLALVNLGTKLNDASLQKQGLQLALDSGMGTPAQIGAYHFFLGKFAYDAGDYAGARAHFQAAMQAGYTQNDPRPAIAETYFKQGQAAQGLTYLSGLIKQEQAAGRPVPSEWLLRGLQVAYQAKLAPQANEYAEYVAAMAPTPKNWQAALQVVNAVNGLDLDGQLDIFRLMQLTGSLQDKHDYYAYVEDADPRKLSSEVLTVLDQGASSGVLSPSDQAYQQAKTMASSRVAANKSAAPLIESDARKSPTGKIAIAAGDQYLSLGQYDKAAEMYQLALTKGVDDRGLAQERLGIAQVRAGQLDAAKATLQQVTGPRAPVAHMWLAYIASKSAAPAAPTPPAPPAQGA